MEMTEIAEDFGELGEFAPEEFSWPDHLADPFHEDDSDEKTCIEDYA